MKKVLVADDSLTIQKVVSITLAGEDVELLKAVDEKELLDQVKIANLVLLDFGLSEEKSGHELIDEIRKINDKAAIMIMLGTFDTVDEQKLNSQGVFEKVVKPFDGNKFIRKCRDLLSNSDETEAEDDIEINFSEEEKKEETLPVEEDTLEGGDWVVDSTSQTEEPISLSDGEDDDQDLGFNEETRPQMKNPLLEEMSGWGVEIPGVIGTNEEEEEIFPSVIEGGKDRSLDHEVGFVVEKTAEKEEVLFPEANDLDYPDMDSSSDETSGPSLVSADILKNDDEEIQESEKEQEVEIDFAPTEIVNEAEENRRVEEIQASLEDEISPDDFWAVDSDSVPEKLSLEVNDKKNVEIGEETGAFSLTEMQSEKVSTEEIVKQVQESLKPIIEEMVKKYCEEKIEQVAWDVIPELAENLIQKEIKEISRSLQ